MGGMSLNVKLIFEESTEEQEKKMKRYKKSKFTSVVLDGGLRNRLIELLRGCQIEDRTYKTVRYGKVPSYYGCTVSGNELVQGHGPTGNAEFVRCCGYISRRPLSEISTETIARIAWGLGLVPYNIMTEASKFAG